MRRKNLITWTLVGTFAVLSLTGCGSKTENMTVSQNTIEATTMPETTTEMPTQMETPTSIEIPTQTETESESVKTYAEEKGIVFEELGSFLLHTMSFTNGREKKEYEVPSTISYQIIEESEETKTYEIVITMQFEWELGGAAGYHLFDTYTGMVLPNPSGESEKDRTHDMGSFEQYDANETITFDEVDYTIFYSLGIGYSEEALATLTYTVQVPAEYDGLGYIHTSENAWDEEEEHLDAITLLEETNLLNRKEIHFFKIGE